MRYIGYVRQYQDIEHCKQNECLMEDSGCSVIYAEQRKRNMRPQWGEFIDDLQKGDCAVLLSFDNAFFNFQDMVFFIKYCSSMNIRIISINDKLDSHDILYPERSTSDTLGLLCTVFSKRDRNLHDDIEAELYATSFNDRKLKRYKLVINMYKAGYCVKDIMRKTGYRGKSNIYRILHLYNIKMEYPSMSRAANKVMDLPM